MKRSKRKYIVGVVVILIAFASLAWTSFKSSFQYSLTPSELMRDETTYSGRGVKIAGLVEEGSYHVAGLENTFNVSDGTTMIPVHYSGIVPNTFHEGGEGVVSGKYDRNRKSFESTQVLARCASKYQAKEM